MQQLLASIIVIGVSGSFYPFEILAALQVLTGKRPMRNFILLLLAYNVPILAVAFLLTAFTGSGGLKVGDMWRGILDLGIALVSVVLAVYTYRNRHKHHPDRTKKLSPIAEYADKPVLLGLVLVVLNPSVFAFVLAALNLVATNHSVNFATRIISVALFVLSLNAATLASVIVYSIRPRWFRARFNEVQHWIARHSWEIILVVLLGLGLVMGYRGAHFLWP